MISAEAEESSRWVYWGPRVELIAVMKERARAQPAGLPPQELLPR